MHVGRRRRRRLERRRLQLRRKSIGSGGLLKTQQLLLLQLHRLMRHAKLTVAHGRLLGVVGPLLGAVAQRGGTRALVMAMAPPTPRPPPLAPARMRRPPSERKLELKHAQSSPSHRPPVDTARQQKPLSVDTPKGLRPLLRPTSGANSPMKVRPRAARVSSVIVLSNSDRTTQGPVRPLRLRRLPRQRLRQRPKLRLWRLPHAVLRPRRRRCAEPLHPQLLLLELQPRCRLPRQQRPTVCAL
jgi:hypothetical protein